MVSLSSHHMHHHLAAASPLAAALAQAQSHNLHLLPSYAIAPLLSATANGSLSPPLSSSSSPTTNDIQRSQSVVEVSYCEGRHICRFRNYR
jgi:hypothetical protein